MNTQSLHTPLSPDDLATCCRLDDLGLLEFELAEHYAAMTPKPVEWWEAGEWLLAAEVKAEAEALAASCLSEALDDGFCGGFVEAAAPALDKLLMIAVMLIAVPLVAWWVGAWVVGVVEGRL